ncbi:MAG: U32 family peptidase, partial [Muribaculaceae bacterium]|nr:U32 family peptidase [Muribaculaceae bacterium]
MIDCQQIELLSPARDKRIAIAAITHGADAVYMGASHHGARASAANSVADVAEVVDFAHRFGAKVYVTVNTLVYDSEIADVERLIADLYKIGVDALIVQDMGILRMNIPPISLHASTQCDIRTVEKARFLEAVGFSQLVMPREFSLDEIRAVHSAVKVPLELFVHGALCVSYSGDCQASCLTNGRSANRGECAQMCRLPYDLIDAEGNVIRR